MAPCSPRGAAAGAGQVSPAAQPVAPPPPNAKKVPHKMELFGDVRVDNYYWLRDDKRQDPDVLAYLAAENDYTTAQMADTADLQELLYQEMRGRIKEEDVSVPLRKGPFFYYTKTLEGKQYKLHCRRAIPGGEGPGTVDEVVDDADSDAPPEEVLLDENENALPHEFYSLGSLQVSPDHKLFAYLEDTSGAEIYTLRVVNIEAKSFVGQPIVVRSTEYLEWVDSETLIYVTQDEVNRPCKVWRHKLYTEQSEDVLLYYEDNVEFFLEMYSSESRDYILVVSGSKTTSFNQYLRTSHPDGQLKTLTPKVDGVDTTVTHSGRHFFIIRRSDEFFNSELVVCPVDDVASTTVLLPHRPSVKLQAVQASQDHLIVYERENGLQSITVYPLPREEPLLRLPAGQKIVFPEPAYSVYPRASQFKSHIVRYGYSSLRTPQSVYDYDMLTHRSVFKKREPVLGGFDIENYVTERLWATAADGVQIPISIIYRKDIAKLDGTDPLLLYGYGAYELARDASFDGSRLSLLDRGVVYAIAHIRGGGEMGRKWYEDGKLLQKKNTFWDFIACAEYLLEKQYGSRDRICIQGRSAGGLLIGGVLALRPDLFTAAVAEVAFVDLITTMLDASIPLTTAEWEEWGNPNIEEYYRYMLSYSPVDNVQARSYPNILVTGGLHDPRVGYWEPAKFVAKLRELKTDDNLLLLKCDLGSGHFSKSGRFDRLKETAFIHAFMLKCLGLLGGNSKL